MILKAEIMLQLKKKINQGHLLMEKNIIDFGKNQMNVDVDKWIALQAIHGVVHKANIGEKYTWFGIGYLSNMYFKFIANHPTYTLVKGGDLGFTSCISGGKGNAIPIQ